MTRSAARARARETQSCCACGTNQQEDFVELCELKKAVDKSLYSCTTFLPCLADLTETMDLSLEQPRFAASCLLLAVIIRRRRHRQFLPTRWWVRPFYQVRQQRGGFKEYLEMRTIDTDLHFKYIRMSPVLFDRLLSLIQPFLRTRRRYVSARRPHISNAQKLVLTLKFLASGQSLQDLAISYRIGHSTVHDIVGEVCNAIWLGLVSHYVRCPSTPVEWKNVASGFYSRWNFPHCIGAIDGKHIVIQAPFNSNSGFFNYKNTHSIVLLAVADSQYRFLAVDIGQSGRQSDGGIFSSSAFGKGLEDATFGIPAADESVPHLGRFPYVLVGDEAFPLRGYLMRPYPGKYLSQEQRIFNYRLSRSRRIIENAFGILVARWRIFRQPIVAKPDNVTSYVKACVALHNFLQTEQSSSYCPAGFADSEDNLGNTVHGTWRNGLEDGGVAPITRAASNNYSAQAKDLRNRLAEYFVSPPGSVSWQ